MDADGFDRDGVRVEWSNGAAAAPARPVELRGAAAELKAAGNAALRAEDFGAAEESYTRALAEDLAAPEAAVLYCNRALCRIYQQRFETAAADAYTAAELRPAWPKPYYRLAQARLELGEYRLAMAACRRGEGLLEHAGAFGKDFGPLMDKISLVAALNGSLAGFDGRLLEVRSAGEEAFLGREAPSNPLFDERPDKLKVTLEDTLDGLVSGGHAASAAADRARRDVVRDARRSFRSVREALEHAKDGDRILLLRGIHNTGGATADVDKRVLICGEGTMEETEFDARANSPVFRITRNAVVQNVKIDMTGFREALMVTGDHLVQPVVENCRITCSGDDAVNVAGKAAPFFRRCNFSARKCCVKVMDSCAPEFLDCRMADSEHQGLKAFDAATPTLRRCLIKGNGEEGVVVMDRAAAHLHDCIIEGHGAPAVDVSDAARAYLDRCVLRDNVGGLWLWDKSRAEVRESRLEGGKSFAVLADAGARATVGGSTVEGTVHATEEAWEGIYNESNAFEDAARTAELPLEEGAFKYEYDQFTRKQ